MSEVLVLRPGDFTGFAPNGTVQDDGVRAWMYAYSSTGTSNLGGYNIRGTIQPSYNQRTISSVTVRFTFDRLLVKRVVCQISSGANDFIGTVGASGSSVGRAIADLNGSYNAANDNCNTEIHSSENGYYIYRGTYTFTFDTPITLAKNTTYYLWIYADNYTGSNSLYIKTDTTGLESQAHHYWALAGATLIGDEHIVPISVSVSSAPYNSNSVVAGWGLYIQNYSQADITVTATGTSGSAITNCVVMLGSSRVWDSSALSGRSAIITTSGTSVPITATVTDATGATASATTTITVYAYQQPNLTNITCCRCNSSGTASTSGTYLYFSGNPSFSSVNNKNSCTTYFRYGVVGGSMGAYTTISNPTTWQSIASGLNTANSYLVEFRVTDTIGNSRTFTITIPTELVTMNFKDGGTGVCFGGYSDKDNCFEIANAQGWKAVISNGMYGDTLPSSGTEGQIFFKSITTPSGSANMDYAMYNSVTDVGLTSGSATIVAAAAAMPMNSYLICPANEFDSTSVPSLYGHIEILIPGAVTRMSVLFRGKEASNGDYRMFVNSSGVPDGTWHKITMS